MYRVELGYNVMKGTNIFCCYKRGAQCYGSQLGINWYHRLCDVIGEMLLKPISF